MHAITVTILNQFLTLSGYRTRNNHRYSRRQHGIKISSSRISSFTATSSLRLISSSRLTLIVCSAVCCCFKTSTKKHRDLVTELWPTDIGLQDVFWHWPIYWLASQKQVEKMTRFKLLQHVCNRTSFDKSSSWENEIEDSAQQNKLMLLHQIKQLKTTERDTESRRHHIQM